MAAVLKQDSTVHGTATAAGLWATGAISSFGRGRLQYLLLDISLFAISTAVIVFCGTLIASWCTAAAVGGKRPVLRHEDRTGITDEVTEPL